MSTADKLLGRLDGVRETGPGRWMARCPVHKDRRPSLSVRQVDDRVLIHDFAGCPASDILVAVGLTLADLFDQPLDTHRPGLRRPPVDWRGLCFMLQRSATVLWLFTGDIVAGRKPDPEDVEIAKAAHSDVHMFLNAVEGRGPAQ